MERLTFRSGKKVYLYHADACWAGKPIKERAFCHDHKCASDPNFDRRKCGVCNLIDRLAAYEDTGLEPEICAAYKKFEDSLVASGIPFSRIIELAQADKEGRCVVLPCKPSDVTIYQLRNKKHARGIGVSPRHVMCTQVWSGGGYSLQHQGQNSCCKKDFGKTWFLTREEAEKVLEEKKHG